MEGVASRVYFVRLFGHTFSRESDNLKNAALNYGYSIILSAVSREIVANGNITQLGIGHSNMFNKYNLASDLVEPLRPFIDEIVYNEEYEKFQVDEKLKLINLLNKKFIVNGRKEYFKNGISIYVKSVIDSLDNGSKEGIKFIEF